MKNIDVAIFMGSASDEAKVKPCAEILTELGISHIMTVASAHRTPERVERLIKDLEMSGCKVYICAAGLAAHLAGAVAARTIRPVIGIPISGSMLNGMDALLSTLQMPPGFPVATMALDSVGAKNAAYLAAQILATSNNELSCTLIAVRDSMKKNAVASATAIEEKY